MSENRRCRRSEGPIFGNAPRPLHQDRQVSYALTLSGHCNAPSQADHWPTGVWLRRRSPAPMGALSPLWPLVTVVRAVLTGQPFDMLKPEHYESWKELELTFDPKDM